MSKAFDRTKHSPRAPPPTPSTSSAQRAPADASMPPPRAAAARAAAAPRAAAAAPERDDVETFRQNQAFAARSASYAVDSSAEGAPAEARVDALPPRAPRAAAAARARGRRAGA